MKSKIRKMLITHSRIYIGVLIAGLALSGITAFPIQTELRLLVNHTASHNFMANWLITIYNAVQQTNQNFPWLSYGTDWLAFAHLILAILFVGPFINPVKNIWTIQFGMISATAIFPLAFIAGSIRHIPLFWQLIDCSFGVIALALLIPCYLNIKKIMFLNRKQSPLTS